MLEFLQGGNDTFLKFPDQLTALVRHALPNIAVQNVTYPRFETRGDLKECVGRFREWYIPIIPGLERIDLTE
jgi:hypothetical protein